MCLGFWVLSITIILWKCQVGVGCFLSQVQHFFSGQTQISTILYFGSQSNIYLRWRPMMYSQYVHIGIRIHAHTCAHTHTERCIWQRWWYNNALSKLERLFSLKRGKRDVRALSFELWNSIRKCHPKWDRLYRDSCRQNEYIAMSQWPTDRRAAVVTRNVCHPTWDWLYNLPKLVLVFNTHFAKNDY